MKDKLGYHTQLDTTEIWDITQLTIGEEEKREKKKEATSQRFLTYLFFFIFEIKQSKRTCSAGEIFVTEIFAIM